MHHLVDLEASRQRRQQIAQQVQRDRLGRRLRAARQAKGFAARLAGGFGRRASGAAQAAG